MWLREIEADRLRNLRAVRLTLPGGLTVIAGRNGHGKSSLLEAVYQLATGRSFRTRRLEELVAWDGGPLRVAGRVVNRLGESRLAVGVDVGARSLLADGAEMELEDYLGRLDVVDLTTERMKVLRGGPEERRKFLDRGVVGLRASYLRSLGSYRRSLRHRNALLRGGRIARAGAASRQLDAWDERLAEAGAEVHRRRREYAGALGRRLGETARVLFAPGVALTLAYRPSPPGAEDVEPEGFKDLFREHLASTREADLEAGHTASGPHRDELRIELGKADLRRFGSAGQVRAAMVALKLGKLSLLHQDRGEAPVFLMDDFDSHLDESRAAALAGFLHSEGFQALVATSKEGLADSFGTAFTKVLMEDGKASIA